MKRLLYWLYLLVKRQLKNPVIVVALIAMPVAALIITHTASLKETGPVRVGIVLEDDDKIAIMTRGLSCEWQLFSSILRSRIAGKA